MDKVKRRENFERIANKRVNEIIDDIISLQNLTNKSFYDYDKKDVVRIISAIQDELDNTKDILLNNKRKAFNL